ncbi:MAG TPA: protein phosphatase 2C domain-containing protein [Bryobacteraceae bacterium]|nr:protein phosphatase 2C domain-containing protein [Bryobacteraceae bacterium]
MRSTLTRSAAVSDPGKVRSNNEDRVYADDERGIYIVIDGVGGEAAGERAAAIAEEELVTRLERSTGTIEDRIREGIALAGKRIFEHARRNPQYVGMSCVLTVAVVSDGQVVVGHVGDTRLYKIRRGALEKITRDHAPVGAREDSGEISEREAMQHPRRNEIFRDVGSEEHAPHDADFIDIQRIGFEPDSALLLCSDGLTDQVASSEIAQAIARHPGNPHRIVLELVRRANEAGGKDNVSVIYVEGAAIAPVPVSTVAEEEPEAVAQTWRHRVLPVVLGTLVGIALGAVGGVAAYRAWFPPTAPAQRVLSVSPTLSGGYATIGAALLEARSGDTIEVHPGTYREQLEMKEGVSVVARPAGDAVLAPRADAAQPGAAVVFRNIRSGSISGLRVVIAADSGVSVGVLVADSSVEIGSLEIHGAASAGIVVRGASNALIRGNTIHQNAGAGVVVEGDATPRLVANILSENGTRPEAPRAGLEVKGKAHPIVLANAFANNYKPVTWEASPERAAEVLKQNLVVAPARARQRPARTAQGSN